MPPEDRDLLREAVDVLAAVTDRCDPGTKTSLIPIIETVEFITQAVDRGEGWLLASRLITKRWQVLADFFELACEREFRAEFYMEEVRRIVDERGLGPACGALCSSIRLKSSRRCPRPLS